MSASAKIADVQSLLTGEPVFLTGSLVAEQAYGMSNAHSDVDIFTPSPEALVHIITKLNENGYTFDARFKRTWERWLEMGFNKWHTNSMRMHSPGGVETNLVFKLSDGHPTTSLAQVLESFDFGLLAVGYDLKTGQYRDMRSYLFPGMNPNGPLPMMPNKRANWRRGLISQYNGLREFGRYAKYWGYGYDMSLVKDDLAVGYRELALYMTDHFDPEKQASAKIYDAIAAHIEVDNIDELTQASKKIDYKDSFDVIMEALE